MKKALLVVTVSLALSLSTAALAAPSSTAATPSCTPGVKDPVVMTSARLHMWAQPISYGNDALAKGPIWDPFSPARPGEGKTMVIYGHDVTPVPGYGKHGPFYRLHLMKRGDLVTIRRCGVTYTYRFVRNSTPWQCSTEKASKDPRRYLKGDGALMCAPNPRSIKQWRVETLYLRCCWPRHTMWQYMTVRLVLVRTQPST